MNEEAVESFLYLLENNDNHQDEEIRELRSSIDFLSDVVSDLYRKIREKSEEQE